MKKLLSGLLFSAAVSAPAFGQITLEHTYSTTNVSVVRVSETDYKFVEREYAQNFVTIYSSDHKLEKTVSFSKYGQEIGSIEISKYTFDLDDEYEFFLTVYDPNDHQPIVYVLEEDGTEIFKSDKGNVGFIYSVGNKALLMLDNPSAKLRKVYSLVGKLYTSAPKGKEEGGDVTTAYPNPSLSQINITHGISGGQQAEVKVYNMSGQVVSTTAFSTAQATVSLSTAGLPAGTYLYVITSGTEVKRGQFLIGE